MVKEVPKGLAGMLGGLPPKGKTPASARVLNAWVTQAEDRLGVGGPRLGWLVATTVVSAVLQRVLDESGTALFLLKGGTMLQYRLPGMSRTTQDIDGLVRGDLDSFLDELDNALAQPWGPLTLVRGEVEVIEVPQVLVKPRRFDVMVLLNGVTWRRVQIEISPDEGNAGTWPEQFSSPVLDGFGLPTPESLTSLAMRYQIAQKVHASSDLHDPPGLVNDRARDIVDLVLLRELSEVSGHPSYSEIRFAVEDIFAARAAVAADAGFSPRAWPTAMTAYPHWEPSFDRAAKSAGVAMSLHEAIVLLNTWLEQISHA